MPAPDKLDFKKTMKPYWTPPIGAFEVVEVPPVLYAMIDGEGDPNTAPDYVRAIQWLYSVSYELKFAARATGRDYGVGPLEGLWWAEDMEDFAVGKREKWQWTMMIMQPDWTTPALFEASVARAGEKLGPRPATLRLERLAEGLSVQIMFIGPYRDEGPTIARLHAEFLPEQHLVEIGKHHEIYLSDPRRVAPQRLRTIIRQPARPAGAGSEGRPAG